MEKTDTDELRELANRLLNEHISGERTLEALVKGLRLASQQLLAKLVPLLGSLAVRMLLTLAIRRVAERHDFVTEITVYEDGIDADDVLLAKSDADYDEVRVVFEDILASFLNRLAQMIGPDLTIRLVDEALAAMTNVEPGGEDAGEVKDE